MKPFINIYRNLLKKNKGPLIYQTLNIYCHNKSIKISKQNRKDDITDL